MSDATRCGPSPDAPYAGASRVVLLWGGATGVGGTETRMAEVVRVWSADGIAVSSVVLGTAVQSALTELLEDSGSPVDFAPNPFALRRVVARRRPAAVLALGLRASLMARTVGRAAVRGVRVVDARNGLELGRPSWLWRLDRLTQRGVDQFVTNSHAAADKLAEHGIGGGRTTVLESALGAEWSTVTRATREPERVIMVGNHRPEKNHELGLRAIAGATGAVAAVVYTDDADALRTLWAQLDHDDSKSVEFVEGHRLGPEDMARASVILHPSVSESLPRVILEARSQGVRVVATDVGDVARIVGPADFLVRPDDLPATTERLDQALRASADGVDVHPWQGRSVKEYSCALLEICEGTA